MAKRLSIFLLTLLTISSLYAQQKLLTLEQAVSPYRYGLYPIGLIDIQWQPNSNNFTYIDSWSKIVLINAQTLNQTTLIELKKLNDLVTEFNEDAKFSYISDYKWLDNNSILLINGNFVIVLNTENLKIEKFYQLPKDAKNIRYNHKAKAVAYTVENNLFYIDSLYNEHQITFDTDKGIVNGDNYVHRQEFGIDNGIFWSPNGNYIAFYRKDERQVEDYPVIDYTTFPAKTKTFKYPFAGRVSEKVQVVVYNLKTNQLTYLQTGQPFDHYLTMVTWDPSEKYIYIGILNRDQNHLWLNKYDIYTGKLVKTLFEEQNPKYVEPLFPLYFVQNQPNKFIYFSQKDGWWHLYLYDTEGKLIRQLTKGNYEDIELIGFSQDGQYVYVQSNKDDPLQRHVFKVNLSSGKMQKLTSEHGTHNLIISPSGKYWIDSYTSTDVARRVVLYEEGKVKKILYDAGNPLKDYKIGEIKIGTITAADGKTNLYYRIILPPDFDPNKKYPVLVYVYGGPHVQLIQDRWLAGASLWMLYFAQNGYIVWTVDNRGSDYRGFEFESVIYRRLGINEMADQIKGVEYLKSLPYVDASRIGVHGWSFGGYMTASLMTTYPDVFKVGVSGAPVIDWSMYEVMYGERYMDTPQSNPEGYAETSVLNKIQNLKGKLLIIHGQIDPVVVPMNTMKLLMKAQELGIQVDYYPYPHQEHGVSYRLHLYQKIFDYFETYLK